MSIDPAQSAPTRITIHPEPEAGVAPAHVWRKPIQKATLGDQTFEQMVEGKGGQSNQDGPGSTPSFWGDDGFGLDDVIDLINPLQHIPIVSTIYRAITGDTIAAGPQLIGGAVLGGVAGAAMASANLLVEQEMGSDVGSSVVAALTDESEATSSVSANQMQKVAARHQAAPTQEMKTAQTATMLRPSLEPLDFTAAEFTAQDAMEAAAAMPMPASASRDEKSETLLELFGVNRARSQQAYAKSQGLIASQNAARDLKL